MYKMHKVLPGVYPLCGAKRCGRFGFKKSEKNGISFPWKGGVMVADDS